jgi:hypothetical protein
MGVCACTVGEDILSTARDASVEAGGQDKVSGRASCVKRERAGSRNGIQESLCFSKNVTKSSLNNGG